MLGERGGGGSRFLWGPSPPVSFGGTISGGSGVFSVVEEEELDEDTGGNGSGGGVGPSRYSVTPASKLTESLLLDLLTQALPSLLLLPPLLMLPSLLLLSPLILSSLLILPPLLMLPSLLALALPSLLPVVPALPMLAPRRHSPRSLPSALSTLRRKRLERRSGALREKNPCTLPLRGVPSSDMSLKLSLLRVNVSWS